MKTISEIITEYNENGYHNLRLNLEVYSADDVEGLVGGYNLKIKCKGRSKNLGRQRPD